MSTSADAVEVSIDGGPIVAKFIAVLNVIAGACSILALVAQFFMAPGVLSWWLILAIFLPTLLLAGYVLFVPGNPIERNVRNKIESYRTPSGHPVVIQRGDLFLVDGQSLDVEFHKPFADPPSVEVLRVAGPFTTVKYRGVTNHGFRLSVDYKSYSSSKDTYHIRWIAQGVILKRVR